MDVLDRLTSPAAPLPRPEANLGYLFRLAHQRFRVALEDGLQDLHLSAQEYGVLSVFENRSEVSTAELARIAQVTRQTMHAAVNKLGSSGMLERRARNQRVILLRPTRRGRARLKAATKRVREIESITLAGLDTSEELTIRTWLATVAAMELAVESSGSRQLRASRS